jgi:hypothetical protein
MLLGVSHRAAIAGVVLHDIGPVIDMPGLLRIKGYLGKLPQPRSLEDGGDILRGLLETRYPRRQKPTKKSRPRSCRCPSR